MPSLPAPARQKARGFTLLEVMLVIALMGVIVGTVVVNLVGDDYGEQLERQAKRFQVVFNMASDYAVLNQLEMGLRVEEQDQTYHFLYLDDQQEWQLLQQDRIFAETQLPALFKLELQLDGLPWETDDISFDGTIFDEELSVSSDGVEIGDEEEERPDPPQVFIFASGETTPFSLIFKFEPEFGDLEPVYYRVNAPDLPPLQLEGPLEDLL